jgi:hypothetical protein
VTIPITILRPMLRRSTILVWWWCACASASSNVSVFFGPSYMCESYP